MKQILNIDTFYFGLQMTNIDKNEFFPLIEKIKKIEGKKFNPEQKIWLIPYTKNNIEYCVSLGFELPKEVVKIDSKITCDIFNYKIVVKTNFEILKSIYDFFTVEDKRYYFAGGSYDPSKIYKKHIFLIKNDNGIMPIGYLTALKEYFLKNNLQVDFTDYRYECNFNFSDNEIKNCLSYLELYDYQVESVKACLKENGIIKLPTSAGKTEVFLALCKLMKLKTLILFSRVDLAQQTLKRALKANLDSGIVQGSNVDENHLVVMSTVQSANKLQSSYDVVIVDECHRAQAVQYQKILKNDIRFRFGFSATPFVKDDYKNALVKRYLGEIIYTLPANRLIELKKIAKPTINILRMTKPDIEEYYWTDAEYHGVINNKYRNDTIKDLANSLNNVMILIQKIEHGQILESLIPNSIFLYGKSDIQNRVDVVKRFEESEKIVLIASGIFDEGISINSIQNLIIAGGGKSHIKTIQRLGRGLRIKENKNSVVIYDFFDDNNKTLRHHSYQRLHSYINEGFTDFISDDLLLKHIERLKREVLNV